MTQFYEIRIKGHLDKSWADWFDGLELSHESNGETLLSGSVADQAALHGILNRLRDLGVQLIAVNLLGNGQATEADDNDKPSP